MKQFSFLIACLGLFCCTSYGQTLQISVQVCHGDAFYGTNPQQDTTVFVQAQNAGQVDTMFNVHVIQAIHLDVPINLCLGEYFLEKTYTVDTTVTRIYYAHSTGCDSIVHFLVKVSGKEEFAIEGKSVFCEGETARLFASGFDAYLWSDGSTNSHLDAPTAGSYGLTVSDAYGCTSTQEKTIQVSSLQISLETLAPTCVGVQNGMLDVAVEGGFGTYSYVLNGKTGVLGSGLIENLASGFYSILVRDAQNCSVDAEFFIPEAAPFYLLVPETVEVAMGVETPLHIQVVGAEANTVQWLSPEGLSCSDCLQPTVLLSQNKDYQVQVTNSAGCSATATVRVRVDAERQIYIPNVFDANASTDAFFSVFTGTGVKEISRFMIFDRYGAQLVNLKNRQPQDPSLKWEGDYKGKKAAAGVYVYVVEVVFEDGLTETYTDDVLLLR